MKKFYRRSISGLLALLICFTTILGSSVTALATSVPAETAKSYSVAFPRNGDANLDTSGTWGHDELHYMNGWTSGEKTWMTTLHTIGDFNGPACYCIEPGVPRLLERTYARYGEDYWKDYPSECNSTIDADTIKTLLGRIMQYGYQGNLSLGWRSQNDADADKLAHMMATQVLVWETVVGERDANFNHIDPGSADAVKSVYRTSHPLYSRFSAYYDSMEASVKKHTIVPSFMARSTGKAQTVELNWDGSRYAATLTDTNGVLSDYTFSSEQAGITFATSGNTLTITAEAAPAETVTISATKNNTRKGVVVWSDGHYGPDGTMQDVVTYSATISDPVKAYLNLKVSYGGAKIIKTSEDGKVEGISFTITGNGVNKTATTGAGGVIQIDNLAPGVYTVTEQSYDKYEPQEVRRVTVVSGQVATVNFNNTLKRGTLIVTKTSEDGLNEGVKFHLYGTSLSGLAVDEYAVTDNTGKAVFSDVLIGTGYTLEEVDTAIRYVVPEQQTAAVEWNAVTNKSFTNILKKWNVIVTKSDAETGMPQGDATLAGAVYGIYKGDQLVDTYTTNANGQFTTKYYVCGDDWTIREITPSEGYLLDSAVYPIGAEAKNYTVEYNTTANDVTEQIIKGRIAIIKHTDDGETQLETPEAGAEFAVFLKAAGSYDSAKASERDYLTCDENGFAETKALPYGIYTVHQTKGWDGRELLADFDVYIAKDGQTYRYLANNRNFESYIKIVKVDAETGKVIPLAGAVYEITAAEDIITPDGTLRYAAGEVVDTVTTDETGLAESKALYLGKYKVREITAPTGYVRNTEVHTAELVYAGQEVEITETAADFCNERQKAAVSLNKVLEQDERFGIGMGGELSAVTFGLFAADELTAADGSIIPADGLLEIVSVDKNGHAVCKTDLPFGSYYLKELSTDGHYILSDEKHPIVFEYAGQNTALVDIKANGGAPIENKLLYGEIHGLKKDEDGNALGGALIGLFKADCTEFTRENAILTATSAEDGGFSFADVPYGNWIVREIEAPTGFVLSEKTYPVTVDADGAVIEVEIENTRIRGTVQLTKTDRDYPDNKLTGAEFTVYRDSNGNKELDADDERLGTLTETGIGVYGMSDLLYGGYFVKETKAPEGFYLDENAYYFEITEDGKIVTVENEAGKGFVNTPQIGSLKIIKTSSDKKVAGFSFRVTGPNGYVGVFTTDKNGEILIENLRIGEYVVSEVSDGASSAYVLPADKTASVFEGAVTKVEMHNELRDTPKTGDDSNPALWLALLGISAAGAAVLGIVGFRKRRKEGAE